MNPTDQLDCIRRFEEFIEDEQLPSKTYIKKIQDEALEIAKSLGLKVKSIKSHVVMVCK